MSPQAIRNATKASESSMQLRTLRENGFISRFIFKGLVLSYIATYWQSRSSPEDGEGAKDGREKGMSYNEVDD